MTQVVQQRAGETSHHQYRSDRLYFSGAEWFFLIRGGHSKGPYRTEKEAKIALQRYITTLSNLQKVFHKPTEDDHHHH